MTNEEYALIQGALRKKLRSAYYLTSTEAANNKGILCAMSIIKNIQKNSQEDKNG